MPLGAKPECLQCKADCADIWHRKAGDTFCNKCFQNTRTVDTLDDRDRLALSAQTADREGSDRKGEDMCRKDPTDPEKEADSTAAKKAEESETHTVTRQSRRPGRGRPPKLRNGAPGKITVTKGKSRRSIFKRNIFKAPAATPTIITCDAVFFKGSYFQVGDIVSLMDEDGDLFYAQIRGLLQDQYAQKSATITWLIPTQNAPPPKAGFDPEAYILGPEEELARSLEYMEFVMHCPSDHFRFKNDLLPAQTKNVMWVRREVAMKH